MSLFRILSCRGNLLYKMSAANISSSAKACEKVLEELQNNPYYNKYAAKISVMQQFEAEEFDSKIKTLAEQKQSKPAKEVKDRKYSTVTASKPKSNVEPYTKVKKLDDIMKTELLKDKTGDEIKQIWQDYHKDKDVIVGVIPKDLYRKLYNRGQEHGTFILPIPRSEGYEFIVSQFAGHEVHFTPLIAYQTHKENAPECLTITHFAELEDKGIVLMKGEYDSNLLNAQEAQCLANEMQLYYAQDNEKRINLLKKFTFSPSEFKHMDLITELETLSI